MKMKFKYGFIDWFMERIVCPLLTVIGILIFLALLSLLGTLVK